MMKSKLKQYLVAIIKVYWPLLLLLVCNDVFAIDSGDKGLDEVIKGGKKAVDGGFMVGVCLAAAVVGIIMAIMNQSLTPIAIAAVIIFAAKLFATYGGSTFTLTLVLGQGLV